jgi:hypothetical protein
MQLSARSGGASTTNVLLAAPSSDGRVLLTASTTNFDFVPGSATFGNDLIVYTNNSTSTATPYMRSDGNFLVIESRSTANGGTIYLGNDNNTNINLGFAGGTTTINTALTLAGLATCTLQVNGAGAVGCVSDSAAKRDIKAWSPGLETVMKLRPVSYKWADGDQATAIGFIAQDVQQVIPEAVRRQEWGGMLTLDDRAILAALVNAVKELRDEQRQRR